MQPPTAPPGIQTLRNPGTTAFIDQLGIPVETIHKMRDVAPHTVDLIRSGKVQLILNTHLGPNAHFDGAEIRAAATLVDVPLLITLSAIQVMNINELSYRSLQDHYQKNSP